MVRMMEDMERGEKGWKGGGGMLQYQKMSVVSLSKTPFMLLRTKIGKPGPLVCKNQEDCGD